MHPKKRNSSRMRFVFPLLIISTLFLILLLVLILIILGGFEPHTNPPSAPTTEASTPQTEELKATEEGTEEAAPEKLRTAADFASLEETRIYTFLQGPKAWEAKADWSGSWCHEVLADQEFSVFGCGLCDLANIYSTLTPCDCSPLDMYEYAQQASDYAPVSGFGAIDWPYLRQTLKSVGITSRVRRKDPTYQQFQKAIAQSITAIVLVCSDNDDTYWHDVEGHYVNIWKYQPEDDTVFLGDSGNPEHNRQRIPLRYLYDALKTYNDYQYMVITEVDPQGNTWQHDGINIAWNKPAYYR